MRVSEFFSLGVTQSSLEFVDVDLATDVALFIDPRAISRIDSEWTDECVALIQDFFNLVLDCIADGDDERAISLLSSLREPNETHLGLSTGAPSGHGLGEILAEDLWGALAESEAARSRLLEDLEDTVLMIPGIGNDLISDMTTNIIRRPLINFTNEICEFYEIPREVNVDSGAFWNLRTRRWDSELVSLPVVHGDKLILVPKAIVRRRLTFNVGDYYRNVILTALQERELTANTGMVEVLRDGSRRVTKKALIERYGKPTKANAVRYTKENPGLLQDYRDLRTEHPSELLSHDELAVRTSTPEPQWDELLDAVLKCRPGSEDADKYHRSVLALLSALFWPELSNPKKEAKIHQGRKRIDITFSNTSRSGFFWRINAHHHVPAGYVVAECKNYSDDIGNESLDQLAGRFSPTRGQFGFLVCRNLEDYDTCLQRCRDAFHDHRGWMIPIQDSDLTVLVNERKTNPSDSTFQHLENLFNQLIS